MEISLEQYNAMAERLTYLEQKFAEYEWVCISSADHLCAGCKYIDSDICNNCKRQWIDKNDYYELNLYTDTFGVTEEVSKQPLEDNLNNNSLNEWKRLWRV